MTKAMPFLTHTYQSLQADRRTKSNLLLHVWLEVSRHILHTAYLFVPIGPEGQWLQSCMSLGGCEQALIACMCVLNDGCRHGQGYHSTTSNGHLLRDPELTEKGRAQCAARCASFDRHDKASLTYVLLTWLLTEPDRTADGLASTSCTADMPTMLRASCEARIEDSCASLC